jgi:GNAT superfamily N-acetyltransferase
LPLRRHDALSCPAVVAGFLTLGSETATSIAITALYTGEIYRNKGVGEALLRSACRASIEKPRPGKTSVIALIPDATVARRMSMSANPSRNPNPADEIKPPVAVRLFARLGFRISQYVRAGRLIKEFADRGTRTGRAIVGRRH